MNATKTLGVLVIIAITGCASAEAASCAHCARQSGEQSAGGVALRHVLSKSVDVPALALTDSNIRSRIRPVLTADGRIVVIQSPTAVTWTDVSSRATAQLNCVAPLEHIVPGEGSTVIVWNNMGHARCIDVPKGAVVWEREFGELGRQESSAVRYVKNEVAIAFGSRERRTVVAYWNHKSDIRQSWALGGTIVDAVACELGVWALVSKRDGRALEKYVLDGDGERKVREYNVRACENVESIDVTTEEGNCLVVLGGRGARVIVAEAKLTVKEEIAIGDSTALRGVRFVNNKTLVALDVKGRFSLCLRGTPNDSWHCLPWTESGLVDARIEACGTSGLCVIWGVDGDRERCDVYEILGLKSSAETGRNAKK